MDVNGSIFKPIAKDVVKVLHRFMFPCKETLERSHLLMRLLAAMIEAIRFITQVVDLILEN